MPAKNEMGIRETLKEKPAVGAGVIALCVLIAVGMLAAAFWPEKKADLSQSLYSDDDGATWFPASKYLVAPFDHNGRPAVVAEVYSYDDGKKQFCAYLARFNSQAKQQLEAAQADAQKKGLPPSSASLYQDRNFMNRGMEVKLPGPNHPWIPYNDPKAMPLFSIHSPDGTVVDQVFVY